MKYDDVRLHDVRILESLRAGVPSRLSTRELPNVHPGLIAPVREDLERLAREGVAPPGRVIRGNYGQGKSHALTEIEHLALDKGFAVSRATLSRETTCHNLHYFYGRVATEIRTPGSKVTGIESGIARLKKDRLIASPILHPNRYSHPMPGIVLECLVHGPEPEDANALHSDLMGIPISTGELRRIAKRIAPGALPPGKLPKFVRNQHADAYFGMMADLLVVLGCKGWVLLVDELELVARLGRTSRMNAYRNLGLLFGGAERMPFPIYSVGAVATSFLATVHGDERKAGDRDLIPALASQKLGVSEAGAIGSFLDRLELRALAIPELRSLEGILELGTRIVEIHAAAHAWTPDRALVLERWSAHRKPGDSVRNDVRLIIEMLDQLQVGGEIPLALGTVEHHEAPAEEDESYFSASDVADDDGK